MKKKIFLTACGILAAAAVPAILIGGRKYNQKQYVTEIRSAVKSFRNCTVELLTAQDEAHPLLPDGIYRASYSPSEKKLNYYTEDGAAVTECVLDLSDRKLYFMAEIKDGEAVQLSACRSNYLTAENLRTRQTHDPFFAISLSEYWLDRYIAYYPYD